MKRIIAIVMTICLMASVLCVPAFALNEAPIPMGVVIRISALKKGEDSPVAIENGEFYSFEDGWNRAMELATDEDAGYDRIVVENAQIFTNTKTVQELMLVPSSAANGGRRTQTFHIPNQNL